MLRSIVVSATSSKLPNLVIQSAQPSRKIRNISWFKSRSSFGSYDMIQETGKVAHSPRFIPPTIGKPPYNQDTLPPVGPLNAEVKTTEQIKGMRDACLLARETLNFAASLLKIGVTTEEVDQLVHNFIVEQGAYPSPLYYRGFPKSICTSINNVVCHGIPDDRPLKDGDIINVDVTVYLNGFHGDVSETFLIGDVDDKGRKLVEVTKKCLHDAIAICAPGRPFNHIGALIETAARKHGFQVVPAFTGHGIGSFFHGAPDIYHCRNKYPGRMEAGMTFTIEPAISQGGQKCVILEDGWTAITEDGGRSAQFEHTVLITDNGVDILTM